MCMSEWAKLITELSVILGVLIPVMVTLKRIIRGERCQLRSEMLQIYYHNRESKTIRQYELENFMLLYEAYKALKGNSFIDKIYAEVIEWEVIP